MARSPRSVYVQFSIRAIDLAGSAIKVTVKLRFSIIKVHPKQNPTASCTFALFIIPIGNLFLIKKLISDIWFD
jgi:hypothetical protein